MAYKRRPSFRNEILRLHNEGYNRQAIIDTLHCVPSSVDYYLSPNGPSRSLDRVNKFRNTIYGKLYIKVVQFNKYREYNKPQKEPKNRYIDKSLFINKISYFNSGIAMVTAKEVYEKYGEETTCYLTGDHIDLTKPRTYQFDHLIPKSRGGDNSLDNLGICTKTANMAKGCMTPEEFVEFCKKVIAHAGYEVVKKQV